MPYGHQILKHYYVESFRSLLSNCDWSIVLDCNCVNTAWTNFKTIFVDVLDQIAPERDVCIKMCSDPWMTSAILEKLRKRDEIRKEVLNPRLTRVVVATPLRFFPGRSKTLKKVTKGI